MKYYVTFPIDGRYIAEVEADSTEEARRKATEKYQDADFGEVQEIDEASPILIEDENDNYVWEK